MGPSNRGVRGRAHERGAQRKVEEGTGKQKGRDEDLRRWGTKKPAERGTDEQRGEGQVEGWRGARMGYLESGGGRNRERRGKPGGKHRWEAARQVEGGTEGQGHRCWIKIQGSRCLHLPGIEHEPGGGPPQAN